MVDLSTGQAVVSVRRKKRYKRKPYKPIDHEKFRETRYLARLTQEQTACLLHVTSRTIALWESGKTAIPYAAYKLFRIQTGYDLPGKAWNGWSLHGGFLWSPAGRRFDPAELSYLSLTFSMARHWREDYDFCSRQRIEQAVLEAEVRMVTRPRLRLVKP